MKNLINYLDDSELTDLTENFQTRSKRDAKFFENVHRKKQKINEGDEHNTRKKEKKYKKNNNI